MSHSGNLSANLARPAKVEGVSNECYSGEVDSEGGRMHNLCLHSSDIFFPRTEPSAGEEFRRPRSTEQKKQRTSLCSLCGSNVNRRVVVARHTLPTLHSVYFVRATVKLKHFLIFGHDLSLICLLCFYTNSQCHCKHIFVRSP